MLSPQPHGINIAIVGLGNCASSLVQGLEHYREGANDTVGLMHYELGGYRPSDIHVVAAWDIDRRKVGATSPRRSSPSPTAPRNSAPK